MPVRYRKLNSSFHGIIEEIPGVYADNFENANNKQITRAYFLSHMHLDHVQGLDSDELLVNLKKNNACIYMSEPSAAILREDSDNGDIMKFVRPLKFGTTTLTLPGDSQGTYDELILNVTLIPAGHCFGSVMFLFRTHDKTVLYTGDFRINNNDLPKYGHLHDGNGEPIRIDKMYVDTTFIDVKYEDFPKRSTSVDIGVEEMRKWLNRSGNNSIALHTSAKYGYENVFNEIYRKLGMKVYVDSLKWNFYSQLPNLVYGVTDDKNSTKIHICQNRNATSSHERCIGSQEKDLNFLYVHFSAYGWGNFDLEDELSEKISEKQINVCYSTHCSRSELIYFVNYLSPVQIEGFPNKYDVVTPRKRVNSVNEYKVSPLKRVVTPSKCQKDSRKLKYVSQKVVREIFDD